MNDYQGLVEEYLGVWNETDGGVRAAAAEKVFADDIAYTDPLADVQGLDGLGAVIAGVQEQFPGWRFRGTGMPDGHGRQVRFSWELGPSDADAPIAGFDVAVLGEDGRIQRVLGFLDRVPS